MKTKSISKPVNVKILAVNAIIAAVYAALTVAIAPFSYLEVQFRISEIMIFLAFYNRKYIPGLILGCAIANLWSPMLAYDITFGTLATAIVVISISFLRNLFKSEVPGLFISALIGAVVNGLLVGLELHLAFQIPFAINAAYVAIGELGVLIIGAFIFMGISRIKVIRSFLTGAMWENR